MEGMHVSLTQTPGRALSVAQELEKQGRGPAANGSLDQPCATPNIAPANSAFPVHDK